MSETFEQGWAARPFKEQFPELTESEAAHLDHLNHAITHLVIGGLLTKSQVQAIRAKKFTKLVSKYINAARKRQAKEAQS